MSRYNQDTRHSNTSFSLSVFFIREQIQILTIKKTAHPGNKSPERLALNSPIHVPLRRTSCVPPVWPRITWKPFRWWGEALLRVHKYHMPKSCQAGSTATNHCAATCSLITPQ